MRKTQVFLCGLAVAGCLSGLTGYAQNTNSADLRGVVTDSNGAVIAGANVLVKDVDKDITRSFTTDGAGLYDTGPIVPDHYLVTVSAPGFKTFVRGPITLNVGTDTLDASLSVGDVSEQVVVTTDLPLLETESGSQTDSLEAGTMSKLPQYGSDWQNFVFLLPGSSFSYRSGQVTSINGNLPYSSVLADGATTTLPMSANADVTVFETTSEVKVDTNSFSAQYGQGGIIFNQITKGGTDHFHGSAYEYFQNDALNAADYAFGHKGKVPFQRYDNYGFSIGGPVLIPHMKKNLFFYFDFDKTYSNGGASNQTLTVPTDAERAGDFTGMPTVYDWTTQSVTYVGGTPVVTRKSFAQEYGNGNKIPSTMISKVAQAFQKFYPEPNVPNATPRSDGRPQNNYFTNVPSLAPFAKYFGRLDWNPVSNHRLTISETASDNPAISYGNGKDFCPVNCQNQDVSRDNAQVSDVWTISPTMVNEARIGFTDQLNFFSPFSQGQGYPDKLGLKWARADALPQVDITNYTSLSAPTNAVYKEMVFDPSDVFTLIHGRHVLHFGGEFLINRADSTAWGNENAGQNGFTGVYSDLDGNKSTSTDPTEYADFLLGYSHSFSANNTPEYGMRMKTPQLFIQDDFKVRPNLTLNLGLRWVGNTGMSEVKGNMAAFDPEVVNGGPGNDPNGKPAANQLGGMWYGFSHAHGRTTLQAPDYATFLPRFGFSWQRDTRTVLRGGVGLYNYSWSEDTYGGGMGNAFGGKASISDQSNGAFPVLQIDTDGSTNYQNQFGTSVQQAWTVSASTPYGYNGKSASYNQYHTPVPKIWQYNLTVQRELSSTMMAQIAYVGSRGWNLNFPIDINQVPASKLAANDVTPGFNARPYPLFTGLGGSTNNGISNYNSLQVQFQKRLSYGFELNAAYTWSKFLDSQDTAGWGSSVGTTVYQDGRCVSCNWGPSNFDVRHIFTFSGIYTLPFGKGGQFLNHGVLANEVLGGWRLAVTSRENTGSPFTPVMNQGSAHTFARAGNQFPNLVGNPIPKNRSINHWFDKAAYAAPADATYGNVHRNSLYGPDYSNVNIAFGKTFDFGEKTHLEVRADARNALNHASFGTPNLTIANGSDSVITSVTDNGRHIQLYGKFTF